MAPPTKRPNWDQYFLRLAHAVASRSECLDKQVGCVIVDKRRQIIGTGYNGFPAGASGPCEHVCAKEQGKPCGMIHAELNAMLYTDMSQAKTMYLTLPPCESCLRHIRNTPVTTVVLPMQFKGTPKARILGHLAFFVDPEMPNYGLSLVGAFNMIRQYHEVLGYPGEIKSEEERLSKFRDIMVAMNQEVAELCDSFPWKPWRPMKDQVTDEPNAIMEMVDIIFFMGSVLELFGIPPERLEEVLNSKIAENYNRIQRGYNKPKKDM